MFVTYTPAQEQIEQAIALRKSRDNKYRNIYTEKDTDMRYLGDLGEICLHQYLKDLSIHHEWVLDKVTDNPDFVIPQSGKELSLEVKTVKRKDRPQKHYTAQVTARHIEKVVDGYLFISYDYVSNEMYFLGYCDYRFFLEQAKHYKEGDYVHANYRIRPGHEIYNLSIDKLFSPKDFFTHIKNNQDEDNV